jgi:hypothetical protein
MRTWPLPGPRDLMACWSKACQYTHHTPVHTYSRHVSSHCYISVSSHAATDVCCVLILLQMCLGAATDVSSYWLYKCGHTATCVSSYCYISVLILPHACAHTCVSTYVSSYCYISVLILLHACAHTYVSTYVSSYCYISVLILLHACAHTYVSTHVSSYCYISVLILLHACAHTICVIPYVLESPPHISEVWWEYQSMQQYEDICSSMRAHV